MQHFKADEFLEIVAFLEWLGAGKDVAHLRTGIGITSLPDLIESCERLNFLVTRKHVEELTQRLAELDVKKKLAGDNKEQIEAVDKAWEKQVRGDGPLIADTLRREASTKLFLAMTDQASIDLFEQEKPFDNETVSVNSQFPDAVYDIREAANCLALSRPGACVFHLMRVLEIGLMRLAEDLGVTWNYHEWQNVINNIRQKIGEIEHGNLVKSGDAKADKRYYANLATQFEHFKDAWRNHAIHVHGIFYDEPQAQIVFTGVREFMRGMAVRFSSVSP